MYDGYNEIDEKWIYNEFLDASKDNGNNEAVLPVNESEMYFDQLAPLIDKSIKIMRVPVEIQYSRLYSWCMPIILRQNILLALVYC